MIYSDEWFLPEERNGFYIRSIVKRAWACQLDMLEQVDRVCRKHGIRYFLDFGSMLGAVREKGYIAWDDDLDIGMLRKDYELFKRYAATELPSEYKLENGRGASEFQSNHDVVVHLRNSSVMRTDPEYLNTHHGCPYVLCIDIFIYDNIPDDVNEREIFLVLYNKIFTIALYTNEEDSLRDCSLSIKEVLKQFENLTGYRFSEEQALKGQLFDLLDYLSASYNGERTERVGVVGYVQRNLKYAFARCLLENTVYLKFEEMEVPVPEGYDQILKIWYGNYLIPERGVGIDHNYPYFASQEKLLRHEYEKRGMIIPANFFE